MEGYPRKQPVRSYSTTVRDKTSRNLEGEGSPLLPEYNRWGTSTGGTPTGDCCKCSLHSLIGNIFWYFTVVTIFGLFLLPSIIRAWRVDLSAPLNPAPSIRPPIQTPVQTPIQTSTQPPRETWHPPPPPPPPLPPYRKAGLSGDDIPSPGSVYIITEANSTSALTYDGKEGVTMSTYHADLKTQRWTCHESEGWLGFTMDPGQSTVFLGYNAWPSPPVLVCSARAQQFNEMFVVSKLASDGFRMIVRDGGRLKPVGRNKAGKLAMVSNSDVWWRFTKV